MLMCAFCQASLDEEVYYAECTFVPYCSQQHARQDHGRHNCEILNSTAEAMMPRLEDAHVDVRTVGSAFRGYIPDMIMLLRVCPRETKEFLSALFPPSAQSQLRSIFNKEYQVDSLLGFFHDLCK
jgi:hypothetical protein